MWADPRFNGLSGEQIALAPGRRRDKLYDHYAIVITVSGHGILTYQGLQYQATQDAGYLFSPDQLCTARTRSRRAWRYQELYISRRLLGAVTRHLELSDESLNFTGARVLSAQALESGRRLLSALRTDGLVVKRVAALVEFIEILIRDSPLEEITIDESGVATRIRSFLQEHLSGDVHNAQLASLVSLTPFHLIRVFHRVVGVPPHRYAMLVRIRRAEQLLRAGVPIADVAHQSGFCDQSHLNRCFRRILGVTPGEYRKTYFFHVRPSITGERILSYQLRSGESLWRYWARLRLARAGSSR
jgi:AraC-like DNA-binding protein